MPLPYSWIFRSPLRKRLWLGVASLAVFVLTLAIANAFTAPDKAITRTMLGHDFTAFYAAGTLVRQGEYQRLYDLETIGALERQTGEQAGLEMSGGLGPYWNPPFYAWCFATLSTLSFTSAWSIWMAINFAALAGAICLLIRMLPATCGWKTWALVPALVLVSMPFLQAATHGQNTFTSLLILATVVTLWRHPSSVHRSFLAGLVAGLLFYKPQLAAVVGAMLVFDLGWPALLGLSATGAVLFGITLWSMPGVIEIYLNRLPPILHYMQVEHAYLWERHVTLKAFWRLLLQGRTAGETTLSVTLLTGGFWLALAGGLGLAAMHLRRWNWRAIFRLMPSAHLNSSDSIARDRLIAATIAAMPLLMPFYFDYDLLLLAVPATLFAAERLSSAQPAARRDRWLIRSWAALFAWMLINPGLAQRTGINLTVPLLVAVASLLIARAFDRQSSAQAAGEEPLAPRLAA